MVDAGISGQDIIQMIAVGGGLVVTLVAIIGSLMRSAARTRELEASRREVAAYVAEGSMTPEDAERILNAGERRCRSKRA